MSADIIRALCHLYDTLVPTCIITLHNNLSTVLYPPTIPSKFIGGDICFHINISLPVEPCRANLVCHPKSILPEIVAFQSTREVCAREVNGLDESSVNLE